MAKGFFPILLRIAAPVAAGMGLAYLVTGFFDAPPRIRFQSETAYSARQEVLVKPQVETVMEKNIFKLGTPLAVNPEEVLIPGNGAGGAAEGKSGDGAVSGAVQSRPQ